MNSDVCKNFYINGVPYKCRTCFDPGRTFSSLSDECEDTKTWRDLLNDVAQIQSNDTDVLPKTLCCKCSAKLRCCYDFILQVHDVNSKYCQLIGDCTDPLLNVVSDELDNLNNCLTESTIDLSLDQYIPEIKQEEYFPEQEDALSSYQVPQHNERKLKTNDLKRTTKCRKNTYSDADQNDCDYGNESSSMSDSSENISLKRLKKEKNVKNNRSSLSFKRKTIHPAPDYYEKIKKSNNRYICLLCQKSFSLRKDCCRHIEAIHLGVTPYCCQICEESFTRKDKLQRHVNRTHFKVTPYPPNHTEWSFGDRLYHKPQSWHLVQCKLCDAIFKTTKDLRQHLPIHTNFDSLYKIELTSDLIQQLFLNIIDLDTVKNIICKDIREKQWFKYYTVLNKYSFEMSLSDTEVEDMDEEITNNRKKYKCDLCAKEFSFKYQVFAHLKEIHCDDNIALKCNLCKLQFVSVTMYEQHSKTHCRNMHKALICAHCPAKFVWHENVKNHNCVSKPRSISPTPNKEKLTCNICNRKFVVKGRYEKHLEKHKNEKHKISEIICDLTACKQPSLETDNKFECSFCNVSFSDKEDLDTHTSTEHTNCSICEKIFKDECDLLSHRKIHVKEYPFKCLFCDASFLRQAELNIHIRLHMRGGLYKCTTCLKSFKNAVDLKSHFQTHSSEKLHKCDVCEDSFSSETFLKRHRKLLGHIEVGSTVNAFSNPKVLENPCTTICNKTICPICGIKLSRNTSFTQHMRTHSGEKPHKCEFCEKAFIRKTDLQHHTRSHTDERPFKCTLCGKSFGRQQRLTNHIRIHTGERPYKCKFCMKTFSVSGRLGLHLRIHTGEKPFSCEICGQAFICGAYLKRHRNSTGHHKE